MVLLQSLASYQQLWSLSPLRTIIYHFKSLSHSKSIPQKSIVVLRKNKEKYRVDTFVPMRIEGILTKISYFFLVGQRFRIRKTHYDIKKKKQS